MATLNNKNKVIWSLIIGLLLLAIAIPGPRKFLFEGHLFRAMDKTAIQYVDNSLTRATTAYALARTFNAIVSVFRESELQLEPGGMGVSLAAGAALDPANDLIERFSWVMLVSMTSLGIQKILIEVVPFLSIRLIFSISLLCLLAGLWTPEKIQSKLIRTGRILLFVAILLRIAVPTMAFINDQVYVTFLEKKQAESITAIGHTVDELEAQQIITAETDIPPKPRVDGAEDGQGWLQRLREAATNVADKGRQILDVKSRFAAIKQAAAGIIDHIVNLIVIFVVSTIFLPIAFLWGIFKLGRLIIDRGFGATAEDWFIEKVLNRGP